MTTPATPAPLPAGAVTAAMSVASTHADMERWRTAAEGTVGGLLARKQLLTEALEAAAPHLAAAAQADTMGAAREARLDERERWAGSLAAGCPHIAVPWRTGRRNGHTIYAQTGPHPSDDDPFVGSLNTPEAAAEAVRAHNAGHDVAAERERCAQLAEKAGATYAARNEPGPTSAPAFLPFADLLRQGGGT